MSSSTVTTGLPNGFVVVPMTEIGLPVSFFISTSGKVPMFTVPSTVCVAGKLSTLTLPDTVALTDPSTVILPPPSCIVTVPSTVSGLDAVYSFRFHHTSAYEWE